MKISFKFPYKSDYSLGTRNLIWFPGNIIKIRSLIRKRSGFLKSCKLLLGVKFYWSDAKSIYDRKA